jgi:hypothetical protein
VAADALDEFRSARWLTDRPAGKVIPGQNPVDRNNHVVDATMYGASGINALALADEISDYDRIMGRGGVLRIPMWSNRSYTNLYG